MFNPKKRNMKVVKQLNNLHTKSKAFKVLMLCIGLLFFNASGSNSSDTSVPTNDLKSKSELTFDKPGYPQMIRDRAFDDLNKEVQQFINRIAPETKLTTPYLINQCLNFDVDIVFVLSQGVIESHLGTKGKAKETNSVWNVGTFDNGVILYTYESQDESITPYLELLKSKYLVNVTEDGDTIYKDLTHLLQDDGYVNNKGKRFAKAPNYENALRKMMVKINAETNISFYQSIMKMSDQDILSLFGPEEEQTQQSIKLAYLQIPKNI